MPHKTQFFFLKSHNGNELNVVFSSKKKKKFRVLFYGPGKQIWTGEAKLEDIDFFKNYSSAIAEKFNIN